MQEQRWTLDELAERVDMALAVDYHGQPSGRVRAVPDRRAIRWYTTIGLIDRPVAHRGRTALYGPRHLLQLVAVKRLQAKGLPLVAIQQELAGATDSQLARVARLPVGARPTVPSGPVPAVAVPDGGDPPAGRVPDRREAAGTPRWAAPAQPPAAPPGWPASHGGPASGATGQSRPSPGSGSAGPPPSRVCGLGLGPPCCWSRGGTLAAADLDAILDAAGPLLAVLRARGLDSDHGAPTHGPPPARAVENEPRREHP